MELFSVGSLKVLVKKKRDWPIVSGVLFFPSGASADRVEGLSLLSLRVLTKSRPEGFKEEFFEIQEKLGASFSGDSSYDYSLVKFQSVKEGFGEYLWLLLRLISSPSLEERAFSVERDSLIAAIRSKRESPFTLAFEEVMRKTYAGTPYARSIYGTEESVSSITLKDVKEWCSSLIFEDSVLSICGDIEPEDVYSVISQFELSFSPFRSGSFDGSMRESGEVVIKRKGSAQSFIMVALQAPSVAKESYPIYKLLNTILGEGIGSVLFQELREKRGFAYSTGSIFPTRLATSRLLAYIGTSPDKEEEVKRSLHALLDSLPDFITEETVSRAKSYFRGTYNLERELAIKRAWFGGFWEILKKGYKYDDRFVEEALSTTREQLLGAAEELSKSPRFTVVVNG